MAALSGLRVIELCEGVAGAYCGRQFAQWGADVVVVETEAGSPLRRMAPLVSDRDGIRHSLLWNYVAANKRAMALDQLSVDLLARADVLITDLGDARLARIDLPFKRLRRRCPALCVVSVTPFGHTGPYATYRGSELVVEALSGYLKLNGVRDAAPLRSPGHLTAYATGVAAFVGALAAHVKLTRTGSGDLVEISAMETLAAMVPYLRIEYLGSDIVRQGGNEAGVRLFRCADGWVSLLTLALTPPQREAFAEVLDIPAEAWPADLHEGSQTARVDRAVKFFSQFTRNKSADAIFIGLEKRGIVCGKLLTPAQLLEDPQLDDRNFFRVLEHPTLGSLSFAGPAARMSSLDIERPSPAPGPNEHVERHELRWNARTTIPRGTGARLPLEGVEVLDLTQAWIGPFATLLLADLGANVIKVESHKRPDVWRQASPNPVAIKNVQAEPVNRSAYFNSVNRNKRDLTIDLSTPDGKSLFARLIARSDVLAENYTPRVMERFGFDYPSLARLKPDLVMTSFSGFGKTGPLSDYKTNGSAIEALAGWDALHHYSEGPPVLMGFYQADAICGLQMAAMTLVALINRVRTKQGQMIDGAMLDAGVGYIGEHLMAAGLGASVHSGGNRDPHMAPHGVFPCRGQDRWIAISVTDDDAWARLKALPDFPADLREPRFLSLEQRLAEQHRLETALATWTINHEADQLMVALQDVRVAAGVVRSAAEGLEDPHLDARSWFCRTTHADLGTHRYNGFLWRFDSCKLLVRHPPPKLGEHSEQILTQVLGLSAIEIEALAEKGVTGAPRTAA